MVLPPIPGVPKWMVRPQRPPPPEEKARATAVVNNELDFRTQWVVHANAGVVDAYANSSVPAEYVGILTVLKLVGDDIGADIRDGRFDPQRVLNVGIDELDDLTRDISGAVTRTVNSAGRWVDTEVAQAVHLVMEGRYADPTSSFYR